MHSVRPIRSLKSLRRDDYRPKTSAFKPYSRFAKAYKKQPHRLDIRQFLVLLYDCEQNMKYAWSTDRLLKNGNVTQVGTCKNLTTPSYSKTIKSENVLDKKKAVKM